MKAHELIKALELMPPDANVKYVWDGEARSDAEYVYVARNGDVIIMDYDECVFSTKYRPEGVPTEDEEPTWYGPKEPEPT